VLVIDIGSHKAQEVYLFEGRPVYSLMNRARIVHTGRPISEGASIKRVSAQFKSTFKCRYVLIEPVMHRELLHFMKTVASAILINGVSSCAPNGPATLFMSRNSLGNSIIAAKPGLTGETRETFNFDFAVLYEFLLDIFVRSGDCEKIMVRMNAEGVEGPIIDFLANGAAVKPDVIAGSIGDVKKCFGQEAYDKTAQTMQCAGIPFVYLTSNAKTWASGLEQIMVALKHRKLAPVT
jgi:hypothetical protein